MRMITRTTIVTALLLVSQVRPQMTASDLAAEVSRLIQVLELRSGMTVADLGAGSGEVTVEIARQLGADSRVYSTDINADRLAEIRKATEAAGLRNVVVIEGDPNGTNLPEGCCDALFTRAVYHHFEDPPAMNASIRAALKPGGRFAVMDFAPDHPQPVTVPPKARASGDTHGVTPDTVVAELTQAGFADAQTMTDWPGGLFLVLVRKPAPNR